MLWGKQVLRGNSRAHRQRAEWKSAAERKCMLDGSYKGPIHWHVQCADCQYSKKRYLTMMGSGHRAGDATVARHPSMRYCAVSRRESRA